MKKDENKYPDLSPLLRRGWGRLLIKGIGSHPMPFKISNLDPKSNFKNPKQTYEKKFCTQYDTITLRTVFTLNQKSAYCEI